VFPNSFPLDHNQGWLFFPSGTSYREGHEDIFETNLGTGMRAIECPIRRTLHGIAIGNADASSNAFAENWKN